MDSLVKEYGKLAKDIEIESSKILNSANQKKDLILIDAKNKAAEKFTKKSKELEEKKSSEINNINIKIEEKKKQLFNEIDSELETYKEKAQKNVSKAATMLLKEIDKKYRE